MSQLVFSEIPDEEALKQLIKEDPAVAAAEKETDGKGGDNA